MQDHINNIIKSMLMEVDMFLLALDINIIVRSAEEDVNRVVVVVVVAEENQQEIGEDSMTEVNEKRDEIR